MLDVADAEFLKEILIREFPSFNNRKVLLDEQDAFGENLFSLRDDHWKHVHSILAPTFTSGKLKQVNVVTQLLLSRTSTGKCKPNLIKIKIIMVVSVQCSSDCKI